MPTQYESSIVRIWSAGESIAGMGFLIDDRKVLTCAHVVASALGVTDDGLSPPSEDIRMDFPLVSPGTIYTGNVLFWQPVQSDTSGASANTEDIAGIELHIKPPPDAHPVKILLAEDLWNHEFRAFGFPGGYEGGVWASGVLRGRQTGAWVQIEDIKETGYFITPGFSGGPVWDEWLNGVVGMVVAADLQPGVRAAFIIPSEMLVRTWPDLHKRAVTPSLEESKKYPNQRIQLGEHHTLIGRDAYGNIIIPGEDNAVNITIIPQIQTKIEEDTERPAIGPNPYQGLSAFHEEDTDRFFGRDQLTHHLWEGFRALYELQSGESAPLRLLPILGPSGSGKSSVARAGLIPELVRQPLPGLQTPRVAVLTPGDYPLEALAGILARVATNDPTPVAKAREFAEELTVRNKNGELDGLRRIAEMLPEIASSPLIVFIDQFEEIYTLCDDPDERDAFVGNLLHAAAAKAAYVSVILTLRSDFLGHSQHHPALNQAIAQQGIIVPVISEEGLRQAIAKPAEKAGHPLDAATIELLITETKGREGTLPLLQFALTRIWEGIVNGKEPMVTLREINGVGGALAGEAQRLYDRFSTPDQVLVRRAFLRMGRIGEDGQVTRCRIPVSDIVGQADDLEHIYEILRVFSQPGARLITFSINRDDGIETVEVTHEALFVHWETLREWLNTYKQDRRFLQDLNDAAREWKKSERESSYLYQGQRLKTALQWSKEHVNELNEEEQEFLDASVSAQSRKRRKQNLIIMGVFVLPLLILGLGAMIAEIGPFAPKIKWAVVEAFGREEVPRIEWGKDGALYVGLGQNAPQKSLARSTDGGVTWQFLEQWEGGEIWGIAPDDEHPGEVYVSSDKGLFRIEDWRHSIQIPHNLPFNNAIDALAISPQGVLYAGDADEPQNGVFAGHNDEEMWRWEPISGSPKEAVLFLKWFEQRLVAGTDHGVWQWTAMGGWIRLLEDTDPILEIIEVNGMLVAVGIKGLWEIRNHTAQGKNIQQVLVSLDTIPENPSKLVLCSLDGDVFLWDLNTEARRSLNLRAESPRLVVRSHFNDPKQFWVGTMRGLYHGNERHWFDFLRSKRR